jgi:cytochrome c1
VKIELNQPVAVKFLIPLLLLAGSLLLSACDSVIAADDAPDETYQVPNGNPERGELLIDAYGCGSCHIVPGVTGANGAAGPPLTGFARRAYIAGQLSNTPTNLIRWIMDPQQVEPGTAMPDLAVPEAEARDMAAYLYTLEDLR